MSLSGECDPSGEIHSALQTEPDGLRAGLAVAFASQDAAQFGDRTQRRGEARGVFGQGLLGEDISGLPLLGFDREGRVQIGYGAPQAHQPGDAPGDRQEQGQGALKPIHGRELQCLDAAALLEHREQQLDFPTGPVPVDQFGDGLQGLSRVPVGVGYQRCYFLRHDETAETWVCR